MNKRTLEVIAGVVGAILGAFLTLGSIILLLFDLSLGYEELESLDSLMKIIAAVLMVVSIGFMAISIKICKNTDEQAKFPWRVAFVVLAGLIAIIEFAGGSFLYGALFALPTVLEIVVLATKEKTQQPKQPLHTRNENIINHIDEDNTKNM